MVCYNQRVTEEIIRCLLVYFPDAASAIGMEGEAPLHCACSNPNVTLNIIRPLIATTPASVRSVNEVGMMPLHNLCSNRNVGDPAAVQILELLIEKCPEVVRHADNDGNLPIHCAALTKCPEFCRLLIEAYPGSERMTNAAGVLPLHRACPQNSLATIEYLYRQYPEAIDIAVNGQYPIHVAILSSMKRGNVEIVQFLLDCDPDLKLNNHKESHCFNMHVT